MNLPASAPPMADTIPPTPVYMEYILGLTAFVAGAVDIISYVKLGGTFASAMTGNLALLGLYLARGKFYSALGSVIALAGFIAGAASGNLQTRKKSMTDSLNILLGSEFIFLVGYLVLWPLPHGTGSLTADALILLLSFAMGTQSILGKRLNLSDIPTVVFTGTLTNLVIGISEMLITRQRKMSIDTKRQIASFMLYFVGAFMASLCAYFQLPLLVFLPVGAVALALLMRNFHSSSAH